MACLLCCEVQSGSVLLQDVENFRANIKAGYLPLPTDVSFGGIVKVGPVQALAYTQSDSLACSAKW
jgi:hypothetical protein